MAAEPFIGEIIIGGWNFPPRGYSYCNGSLLSIAQNTALFAILGTTYGGNGQTTFALPDLRSRIAVGFGQGPGLSPYSLGEQSGWEQVTLLQTQMPQHTHAVNSNNGDGSLVSPVNNHFAGPGADRDLFWYNNGNTGTTANLNPQAVGLTGGNFPHSNMMPYQCVSYCIALEGIFPSRN